MKHLTPPRDPVRRYIEIYHALNAKRRWFQGSLPFRFAALTLATARGAADLKETAGWFGALNSSVRFVIAALLVRNGDDAVAFAGEVERVKGLFRKHRLPRGGIYEIIATLVLRRHRARIEDHDVLRVRAMYDEMKKRHWWLTGVGEYPYCAAFAALDDPPSRIGERVDRLYELLRNVGCTRGNQLQRVSHILYLNPRGDGEIAACFARIRDLVKTAGTRIYETDWDELALLTFLEQRPEQIVGEALAARDEMLELKPSVGRWTAFTLGCSLAFLKLSGGATLLSDTKALEDLQLIIEAQEAGAAAGAAAASS